VISSAIGVGLAIAGYGVKSVVASAIANAVMMTIILFSVRGVMPNFRIYSRYNKDILSYGGWLTGSVIVRRITTELDKFILTRWIPVAQIGAYNRPANFITSIVDRVNGIFDTVLFPILSSYSSDKEKLKGSFLTASSLVSWFSMILMAAFVLSAQIIIDIFFGSEWEWLVGIFRILSLSVLFLAYSRIGDCYFRSLGWVKAYFYIRLVVCLITLACVSVGCQYGIVGVAISVVVSRVMDSVIKMLYLSIKLSVRFLDLAKAVLTPTWITMLVTIGCYLITRYVPYGEYTAILLFMGVGMILLIAIPQMFGKEYYENVYSVVKSKILSLKK
jgi:O-antigen/teichoic acid export membrane protein